MERVKAYLEELKAEPEKWLEEKRKDYGFLANDQYTYYRGFVQSINYALDFIEHEQNKGEKDE